MGRKKKFNTPEEKKAADKKRKARWYQKNKVRLNAKKQEWRIAKKKSLDLF